MGVLAHAEVKMNWSIIVDIVLVAIVVITIFLGVKRGFVKSLVGLVSTAIIIAVAVLATSPLTQLIVAGTNLDDQLAETLEQPLAEKLPNAYATVYYTDYDNDPVTDVELVYKIEGEEHLFNEIFDDNAIIKQLGLVKLIRPSVEKILEQQAQNENIDLDDYSNTISFVDGVTVPIATAIITVIVFIALLIVTKIVLWILLKIFKKIVSRLYIAHFIDKMLGGIFGLAMGALLVLILLTILQLLSPLSFMEPVNDFLDKSVVTKFLMDNNILYRFVSEKIDLESIMSKIG